MDITSIRALLRKGVSDVVEATADAVNIAELEKTVCAMSNSNGGHIIVGVDERINPAGDGERFRFNGLLETRGIYRTLEQVGDYLEPPVKVEIDRIVTEKNRAIFVIGIQKHVGREMVSLRDGVVYVRSGSKNVEAGIFKPKTSKIANLQTRRYEEIAVLEGLFSIKDDLVRAGEIAELTGIDLVRIEGHLENLAKEGLFRKAIRTSNGLMAEVTAGDRLQIENRLNELRRVSDQRETQNEYGSPSTGFGPPESEASPRGKASQADASDMLEFTQKAEVEQTKSSLPPEPDDSAAPRAQDSQSRSESPTATVELANKQQAEPFNDRQGDPIADRSGQPIIASVDILLDDMTSSSVTEMTPGNKVQIRREAKRAALKAKEYGEIVAGLLAASPDNEAMTFALFGHWGRGKTFQMRRITEALNNVNGGPEYRSVWFSAWKYRSTPETWIYLFQQLLQVSKRDSRAIPWRAAFAKTGPWTAIIAMLGLMVSLLPAGGSVGLGFQLVQILGFGSVVYLLSILFKFRSAGMRISRGYTPADHSEKLGMQAAIGDDIKYLLEAWMPRPSKVGCCLPSIQFTIYVSLALIIACQLWHFDTLPTTTSIPYWGPITTHVHPFATFALLVIWISTVVAAPTVIFWPRIVKCVQPCTKRIEPFLKWLRKRPEKRTPSRVLLVIDDLDRCDPLQMLDIVESTLLILDDEDIKARLQVAILIDEFVFERALSKKYDILLSAEIDEAKLKEYDVSRLVRENQEKFFLLQLRLPRLRASSVHSIVTALSDDMVAKAKPDNANTEMRESELSAGRAIDVEPEGRILEQEGALEDAESISVDVILYEHERDQIAHHIGQVLEGNHSLSFGPRSINCILHRYQMGRAILSESGEDYSYQELAKAIVYEYAGLPLESHDEDSAVLRVAKLVS